MKDVITYRKPSAKARAAHKNGKSRAVTSTAYKGFAIVKCLVGGYRVEYNGKAIQPASTIKQGKVIVDKLSKMVA